MMISIVHSLVLVDSLVTASIYGTSFFRNRR